MIEEQVLNYRRKLIDAKYMNEAINAIAGNISTNITNINNTKTYSQERNVLSFGERIKYELEYLGMTQKELARKAGMNVFSIYDYCSNRKTIPRVDYAIAIAKVLGVSVEYLVTGEEPPKKEERLYKEIKQLVNELEDCLLNGQSLIKKYRKLLGIKNI